ncbi:hypothetical protein HB364_00220 [Pseudoflavitalea sp. X16]|uniref:hypothetical protein n=1 Tax=Paraflavitalea devenefica TaxID=2716334 RepID=UPI001420ED74|nr:hypothetical protein [Paraflavitalea devenefica]NII23483.1 hypothetical protein [Paraflavitalea devenefica]
MRSEEQHIDDFFRKKEEEYQQGTGSADSHWEQMRGLLKQGATPTPKGYRMHTTRRIIKYLGGFTVVTVITLVVITTIKSKKKAPVRAPLAQTTIAARQKQQVAKTTATVRTAVKKKAPITPVNTRPRPATTQPAQRKIGFQPGSQPIQHTTSTQLVTDRPSTPAIVSTLAEELARDSAAAATAVTNTATNATTAMQQLNSFYKQLEKEGQQFVIDINKDTILTGKEGTRLSVPAQAFSFKNGSPIQAGNITIVLREYYSYEDILAAKLSTTSGGEQLISGGMVHIAAKLNEQEVKIAPRKNIQLEMPTKQYDEQMQLFQGTRSSLKNAFVAKFMENRMIDTVRFMKREADENGDIDWAPLGQVQSFRDPLNREIKVLDPYGDPYRVAHSESGKIKAWFYVSKACPYSDAEMKQKLKEHSNYYFDKIKIKRVQVVPVAQYQYRKDRISIAGDSVIMTFRQALRKKLLSPEDSIRVLEKFIVDSIDREKRHQLMNKYSFTITNLGWFNCDRFNRDRGPKVLFAFKPGEGFEPSSMVSHLVFTRYRSVLPGGYKDHKIYFGKVPKDEVVKIVSIGVKNGKVMACIQELNTDKDEISDLAFTETTPEEFKQKLQALNLIQP